MYILFFFNLKILPRGQAWKQQGYRDHHYQNHFSCNSFLLASDFIHYELLLEILILIELVNIGETFLNLTWWFGEKKEMWNNWAAGSMQFSIYKNSLQIGDVSLFVRTVVQFCLVMFSENKKFVKRCKNWAEQQEKIILNFKQRISLSHSQRWKSSLVNGIWNLTLMLFDSTNGNPWKQP